MRIDSSSTRITSVTCGLLALLVTALATGQTVAAAGNSLTVNQITVETRYHPGGSPGGTNQAVQAFNSDSTTVGGYTNAPRSLPHLSGISNQSLAGSNQNIAWRVRINVTSVGTLVAGFRFGMDFGLGGTFLVDGQVIQQRWTDMWWNGGFGNTSQYLQGSVTLSPGAHIVELYGFERCCDGATLSQLNLGRGWQTVALGAFAPPDLPPTANAGADFSANEGQAGVMLDGSGSSDPNGDPLTYAWQQVVDGSQPVMLSDDTAAQPTFTAPGVALGGETLTFKLTVTANGQTAIDTVSVTVVNVNHPPVAEAGADRSIAEGSPVTLDGGASFDIDGDLFTYAWTQVDNGSPTVTLTDANSAAPSFTAPYVDAGGAAGVVAALVFQLRVDDGLSPDAAAPGYELANVVDTVTVEITNVNNLPTADAGDGQTVDENSPVSLDASDSSDPDSDPLSFAWAQTGGPTVTLAGAATSSPSFTAPFVSPGGADFTFTVTVDDGYGGSASDEVVVHVQNANDPPDASLARPTVDALWPPNHRMVSVGITNVSDPDSNATITITSVTQDEPTMGLGDGDTAVDAVINADGTVLLRAERSGTGDGRVYHIHFTASDYEGSSSGVVTVSVPHSPKRPAIDGGELYSSTQ